MRGDCASEIRRHSDTKKDAYENEIRFLLGSYDKGPSTCKYRISPEKVDTIRKLYTNGDLSAKDAVNAFKRENFAAYKLDEANEKKPNVPSW